MFVKPVTLPDPKDPTGETQIHAHIRDPQTRQPIPADGIEVPDDDFFWLQRLAHKDVVLATPPLKEKPEAKAGAAPAADPAPDAHEPAAQE